MRGTTATALWLGLLAAGTTAATADEWTGVYIGIGGGMGAAVHELSVENGPAIPQFPFAASLDGLGGDGGFFSLGAGVDYQVNSRWVVGAFFDYDWMSLDTEVLDLSVSQPISFSAGADIEVEDMWSVGGRIGHLVTPSTLLFLTAGYARADISDLNFRGSGGISGTLVRVGDFDGYFIGGGAELKITQAISLKAEYRYTDLGDEKVTLLPGLTSPDPNDFVTTKLDPSIQTARLALNYRFGLGRGEVEPDPVEEAPVGSWTQFYISAGGGYAMSNSELTLTPGRLISNFVDGSLGTDGLGGEGGAFTIGAGYDLQIGSKIVAGAFVDYTQHDADFDVSLSLGNVLRGGLGFDIRDEVSVGGRLGYLVNPSTLFYGTVGYSHLDVSDTIVSGSIGGFGGSLRLADNGSFSGIFFGAGVEAKLTDAISLKGEYRYTDVDSSNITLLPDVFPVVNDLISAELDPDIQTVRLSLSYRFGLGREEAAPLK